MTAFDDVRPRLPQPAGPNADFYRHAASGRLHLQQCLTCASYQHPPRYRCRSCGSARLSWQPVEGVGSLYSWTVTHIPFDRGWDRAVPYSTGVVELPEGIRLVAALAPEVPLNTGTAVRVVVHPIEEVALLRLVPAR